MFNLKKDIAILLFANTSGEEVKQKDIANSKSLFQHLNTKVLKEVKKTGLDVIVFSEKFQQGNTFGERFSNAVATIFEKGYQHIITIGNDSPNLSANHINEAKENLYNNKYTLGPSLDGGSYLITLSKNQFNKKIVKELPWQTSSLFEALYKLLSNSKYVHKLNLLKDINNFTDLKYFLLKGKFLKSVLQIIIANILNQQKKVITYDIVFTSLKHTRKLYNKGSPIPSI